MYFIQLFFILIYLSYPLILFYKMKSYTELVKQSLPKILCVGKNYLKHVK